MGSTRLPGKVLADIAGQPMVVRVVARVRQSPAVHETVVVTSTNGGDDPLAEVCRARAIACFRGSEEDVLDRYYQAARAANADAVVRITADCPLIDSNVLSRVVRTFLDSGCDYAANSVTRTFPAGLDVEVMSMAALERAWREATQPAEREHVTPYLRDANRFAIAGVTNDERAGIQNMRWTVDDARDLAFVRAVYGELGPGDAFGMPDVLALLDRRPDLPAINAGPARNEGYYKSLADEPAVPRRDGRVPSSDTALRVVKAAGSRVWDAGGAEYIDYDMGNGDRILGHEPPAIAEAVSRAVRDGMAVQSLLTDVRERLASFAGTQGAFRFYADTSDALRDAVAAARAMTGRQRIAEAAEEMESAEEAVAGAAAIVVNPLTVASWPASRAGAIAGQLAQSGAVLIVDSRNSALRWEAAVLAPFANIPMLVCFGCAIGNGHGIAALAGLPSDVSLDTQSAAPSREAAAAAAVTVSEVARRDGARALWAGGERLHDGFNVLARLFGLADRMRSAGTPARPVIAFAGDGAETLRRGFSAECLARGVVFSPAQHVSLSHTEGDIDYTLRVYRSAMEAMAVSS